MCYNRGDMDYDTGNCECKPLYEGGSCQTSKSSFSRQDQIYILSQEN